MPKVPVPNYIYYHRDKYVKILDWDEAEKRFYRENLHKHDVELEIYLDYNDDCIGEYNADICLIESFVEIK